MKIQCENIHKELVLYLTHDRLSRNDNMYHYTFGESAQISV